MLNNKKYYIHEYASDYEQITIKNNCKGLPSIIKIEGESDIIEHYFLWFRANWIGDFSQIASIKYLTGSRDNYFYKITAIKTSITIKITGFISSEDIELLRKYIISIAG